MGGCAHDRPECLHMSFSCHGARSALSNAPVVQQLKDLLLAVFLLCQTCSCSEGRGVLKGAELRRRLSVGQDYRAIE